MQSFYEIENEKYHLKKFIQIYSEQVFDMKDILLPLLALSVKVLKAFFCAN